MTSARTGLQSLGRALMLPIAVLPIAGLLLRLGQPDIVTLGLNHTAGTLLSAAGGTIFDQLGLLFAVGVATGFARDGNGAACLAGVTCFLVATKGAEVFLNVPAGIGTGLDEATRSALQSAWRAATIQKFDVPLGTIAGLVGGHFYNRFSTLKLPDYLAFFGGRRFVPIISGVAGVAIAAIFGLSLGPLTAGVDALSHGVVESGNLGLFAFGLLNRLLIPTGLHHILNNVAYFIVGDWHGVTGDLRRFFAGDPRAGAFMSGFFPVMMFALPAACLAMYHEVEPSRRKEIGGFLFSAVLTSVLTGVTEPIEFSFMFCAPLLYATHAVLTGLAAVVMNLAQVRLGYTFSAGLIDYVLNFNKATRPLLLLPVGIAYASAYYGIFRFAIRRWNLRTPGREAETGEEVARAPAGDRGVLFVAALGGAANLREVGACTTRLRLIVADQARIDEAALRKLGAVAVLKPSAEAVQVVLGPVADAIAMDMQAAIGSLRTDPVRTQIAPPRALELPHTILSAVGGAGNVVAASRHPGRWRLQLRDAAVLSLDELSQVGVRAAATPRCGVVHLLVDDGQAGGNISMKENRDA